MFDVRTDRRVGRIELEGTGLAEDPTPDALVVSPVQVRGLGVRVGATQVAGRIVRTYLFSTHAGRLDGLLCAGAGWGSAAGVRVTACGLSCGPVDEAGVRVAAGGLPYAPGGAAGVCMRASNGAGGQWTLLTARGSSGRGWVRGRAVKRVSKMCMGLVVSPVHLVHRAGFGVGVVGLVHVSWRAVRVARACAVTRTPTESAEKAAAGV